MDGAASGAWNMAVDEAIYRDGRQQHGLVLRCYSWEGKWHSIGYFAKLGELSCRDSGNVVRRLTGGGVVEHGEDFTFSVSIPARHPLTSARGTELYRWIHTVVSEALRESRPGEGYELAERRDLGGGDRGWCFREPVPADVLSAGRKVVGGAMKRSREGILYQGSVQLCGLGADFGIRLACGLAGGGAVTELPGVAPSSLRAAEDLAEHRYGTREWLERR